MQKAKVHQWNPLNTTSVHVYRLRVCCFLTSHLCCWPVATYRTLIWLYWFSYNTSGKTEDQAVSILSRDSDGQLSQQFEFLVCWVLHRRYIKMADMRSLKAWTGYWWCHQCKLAASLESGAMSSIFIHANSWAVHTKIKTAQLEQEHWVRLQHSVSHSNQGQ